jgi:hypothetical protein
MVGSGDDMPMDDKGRNYDKGISYFYHTYSYAYMNSRGWDQARGGGGVGGLSRGVNVT